MIFGSWLYHPKYFFGKPAESCFMSEKQLILVKVPVTGMLPLFSSLFFQTANPEKKSKYSNHEI